MPFCPLTSASRCIRQPNANIRTSHDTRFPSTFMSEPLPPDVHFLESDDSASASCFPHDRIRNERIHRSSRAHMSRNRNWYGRGRTLLGHGTDPRDGGKASIQSSESGSGVEIVDGSSNEVLVRAAESTQTPDPGPISDTWAFMSLCV
jgi:hypothetical protein